ncbi:MAG: acetylxylan esterase [Dehalococcoidia bacterium]
MSPTDLQKFWKSTVAELGQTPMNESLTPDPEQSGREYDAYLVKLDSFQGKRLRGWYSVPKDPPPGRKLPGILGVPGYQGNKTIPVHLVQSGFAVLTLFPRGQGESKKEWELEHSTKLTYYPTEKDKFYYRGGYMDCLRGLDFLSSRAEVDASRLGMWSRSQGGGFTLATAALDSRLQVAVAEQPFLCNYPESSKLTSRPYCELTEHIAAHPEQRQEILDTLAYFDPLHLAESIVCPTLVDIGLKDETCPYHTIMPVFEKIRAPKAVHVYPDLTHSACTDFNAHALNWLRRYLGA